MIKINLEKKLDRLGIKLSHFKDKYIIDILDYEHKIVTTNTNGLCNRFSLNINLNNNTNVKYKLEQVLFDLYTINADLKIFIDTIFQPINNLRDSRELLKQIILMEADNIKIKIGQIERYPSKTHNSLLKKIFNYARDRDRHDKFKGISARFKEVDFRVCIYCNRNFISNFHTKGVTRATYTLDHFYQKADYPIFALSLYNLVPSCAVCNVNIKGSNSVNQYDNPYSKNYNFEEEAKFKLLPNHQIKLITANVECYKYIKSFYHNEVYSTHTLEVKEFVKKREVFTDDMINKLSKLTSHSESRIKAFIFGEVLYKKSLDTESLGKLKVDIAKELKII